MMNPFDPRQSLHPQSGGRGRLAAAALLSVLVAGCPSVVPYEETAEDPVEADAVVTPEAEANDLDRAPSFEFDPAALSRLEPATQGEPEDPPPTQEPWRTADSDGKPSSEAPDVFANTSDAQQDSEPTPNEEPRAGDEFGDLLAEEYQSLPVASRGDDAPAETVGSTQPRGENAAQSDDESQFGDLLAQEFADMIASRAEAEPEQPAVAEPEPQTDSQVVILPADESGTGDSLLPFGDLPIESSPLDNATDEPAPTEASPVAVADASTPDGSSPFAEPPIDMTPDGANSDSVVDRFDDPPLLPETDTADAGDPGAGDDRIAMPIETEAAPPLATRTPDPPAETAEPEAPTNDRSLESDRSEEQIEPLPEVPVLAFNTKHLAWLLGAKLGLAELADLDGATPDEIAAWTREVERLSRELGVTRPTGASTAATPEVRVSRVIQAAAAAGSELAIRHGGDHAALLEIALKTNALLVIASDRPEVSKAVGDAVSAAANRAGLPSFVWKEPVERIVASTSAAEALDAVSDLHERVELHLR